MKLKLLSISVMLAASGTAFAAEIYNPNNNYAAGEQVEFNGNIYEAQWWANANQTPASITQNSWDSPWIWVSEAEANTPPTNELPAPPVAEPTPSVDSNNNPVYAAKMREMAGKMADRINELREYAQNPDYFFFKEDGKKYIKIDGIDFEINEYGNPRVPFRHWSDTSAMQVLFPFFDAQEWDLTLYDYGGMYAANKTWGNYDWGNGCLVEYYPTAAFDTNHVVLEAFSCSEANAPGFGTLEDAKYYNPHHFGVNAEYSNLVSFEEFEDKIIVAHSSPQGDREKDVTVVGIYDTAANTTTKILGINEAQPYQRLDDLRRFGSKLFVSAASGHNRIDVFSLDNAAYQYSLSVSHTGKARIAVNDQFILVADDKQITVYLNETAELGATKRLQPFAYLAYAHGTPHSLEFINGKVLAGGYKGSAVYNLNALSQGQTMQAERSDLKGVSALDANGEYIFVKEDTSSYEEATTRFGLYDINQFVANGYDFKDAAKGVYLIDNFWVGGHDLLVTDKGIISLSNSSLESVEFDKLDTLDFTPNEHVNTAQLEFAALPEGAKVRQVLQNGLNEGLWSLSANAGSMVNVRLLDRDTVEITNFTGENLKTVDLDVKAHSQHSWARLATIDQLPAYTRITLPITALNANKQFNTVDVAGVYDLTGMLSTMDGNGHTYGQYSTKYLFDSRFSTTTDSVLINKLQNLPTNWDIEFTDKLMTSQTTELAWDANSVKRHIELITNTAYVISSDAFKQKLMNYKATYGHELRIVGVTLNSEEQYANLLSKTIESNAFTNYRKKDGFQGSWKLGRTVGTVFGLSDAELAKVERGDVYDFAIYLGKQVGLNWFDGCPPLPCNWKDVDFAKLYVDVYNELAEAGELPY